MELRLERATARPTDGFRAFVDRLWPRGVSKESAGIDPWSKDTASSAELRRAWRAAPDSEWGAFADRHRAALAHETAPALEALEALEEELRRHPVVTLVYAAHDPEHNHALVLVDALRGML